ncbi:putative T7SS-secreted protein [Streptomyces sp. HNM0575]|uniref:putative T7SS-secreted protein n=1 Tax=Streptomyces sp. HNM0575 TaxID=2716338 RepID=UPI0019CFE3C3|nr:hypothetical protein [Streptomyces sp. HNM0575]
MSYRSMFIEDDSSWPGLGFNPAKGDTEAIDLLASDVKAVGDELEELDNLIKSVGERGGAWEGEAAERFTKKLGELPKYLKQGTDSMHDCAKALRSWHGKLQEFQRRAERTEADAVEARKQADREAKEYTALSQKYAGKVMPAEQVERANAELDGAKQAADKANDRLDELIREGERILSNWKDRAGEAERAILKASENHPPDLSLWGRITDALSEGWRDFKDWLVDNADLLSNISAGLGAAALALQCIPVVGNVAGGIVGVAAGICAAGAMAGHWMGNARGNGTPGWKVGLDALGVLPMGKGLGQVISPAVKGGGRLAQGAKGVGDGLRESFSQAKIIRPAEQQVAKMFGKPFDPKTAPKVTAAVDRASQITVKSGTFVHGAATGAWDSLTGNDSGKTAAAPTSANGKQFHSALAK